MTISDSGLLFWATLYICGLFRMSGKQHSTVTHVCFCYLSYKQFHKYYLLNLFHYNCTSH